MFSGRPFSVTLLLWMVLSLSAWGAIRAFAALRGWDVLVEFDASLSPLFLLITGAIWCIAGVALLWSIWSGKSWSHLMILAGVLLWLAEYWIERLFFQGARPNLPFSLALSALLVVVTLSATLNRYTRNFFARSEEHEQSDEDSAPA